jgi:hypothetical protein
MVRFALPGAAAPNSDLSILDPRSQRKQPEIPRHRYTGLIRSAAGPAGSCLTGTVLPGAIISPGMLGWDARQGCSAVDRYRQTTGMRSALFVPRPAQCRQHRAARIRTPRWLRRETRSPRRSHVAGTAFLRTRAPGRWVRQLPDLIQISNVDGYRNIGRISVIEEVRQANLHRN